jgi:hypothetical protein
VAINQKLLGKITKRLGVSRSRVYAIITETAGKYNLPADVAALVVARDAGIAITRFASAEDFNLIRGVHSPSVAAIPSSSTVVVAPAHPSRAARRSGRTQKPKGNKVWVVYGRDEEKRKALFAFLLSLGLQPIEWDSALAATKNRVQECGCDGRSFHTG